MKATDPLALVCAALAALALGGAAALAQPPPAPPPVRLGEPQPPGGGWQPAPPPGALPASPTPLGPAAVTPPGPPVFPSPAPDPLPARTGEILIEGNEVTKDPVIRRQLPFKPGQILGLPDTRLAERNLASLGIFVVDPRTGVRPTVTIDPDSDGEFKKIFVRVQEAPTTGFLLGLSVNSDAGLNGHAVFEERNFDLTGWPNSLEDFRAGRAFRGGGQDLRIEVSPGTQDQRYTLSFREPFLFDSLYSLQTNAYFTQFAYHDEYTESRLGTRITIGRKLDRFWSFEGSLRLEDVGVHHIPFEAPPAIQQDDGDHAVIGFRGGVTFDNRDSIVRPTQGLVANLSIEQFLGDYTFPKVILGAKEFWTVGQRDDGSGKRILVARGQLGYAGSQAPVFERFYAGGLSTLRGFAFRGVGPSELGVEVGGDFELLAGLEYQAPLLLNDLLYGVAFVDSGTVEPSVEIRDYRVSAGLGLRVFLPKLSAAPLAFDFATPLIKAHGDHTQVFSFFVGVYY
jgi:outer membrane protein assembly factor BamA